MQISYRLTKATQLDLIDIRQFTRQQWGDAKSEQYLTLIKDAITLLSHTPFLGKKRSDLGTNIYSFPCSSHIVYYVISEQQLVIFAVLHKRMVPKNHTVNRSLHEKV